MPSINMIAPRRAEKRRIERDMRRLVVVIVVELIIAVGLGGWVCTKLLTTRARIDDYDAQIQKLQPVVAQIKEYETATKGLAPKMALLNQAKESTMRWYGTLDKLTQCMPASTYLTGMTTTKSNAQLPEVTVNLAGVSVSQERIGEAMIRLHDIPELQRVDLHFSQSAVIDRSTVIGFEIGAVMKGSPEVKGAKTNGPSQS